MASNLFAPLKLRDTKFRNRIGVSPMCQYSSEDGFANDWHLVHLGSRAAGGAGMVMTEAAAVEPRGRISPADLGIWQSGHVDYLARIAAFLRQHGAVPAMQLAHTGRKASTRRPWEGGGTILESEGGWRPVAPSPIPFRPDDAPPIELSVSAMQAVTAAFRAAADRALSAGFDCVEIHAAHGYLLHEFLSPLSNRRTDAYGGSFDNRIRFPLEVIEAVRGIWPERLPLFMRISSTDWAPGGWSIDDSVELARRAGALGVDLVDCSSGGLVREQRISPTPGYQVAFAERIRRDAGVATAAVGLITSPEQADEIVGSGRADMVLLARQFLRDPYFPLHAARKLGVDLQPPAQYLRAF